MLETFLSLQRGKIADQKIPSRLRGGRILDIGCGDRTFFLKRTCFQEKYGVDRLTVSSEHEITREGIQITNQDIERDPLLSFPDGHFTVVTMLAVSEHLEPGRLPVLLNEIFRVLAPHGVFIMTTPASWADALLRALARFHLINAELFAEHKDSYTHSKLKNIFLQTEFAKSTLSFGYFELFMNLWAVALKL